MSENKELYAAMAKAFPEIEGATKDRANPAFKGTKYADLSSVMDAIKPALIKNGLWLRQVMHEHERGVCVETFVCHSTGQEISFGKLFVPASKTDAQGFGSALTYARRYSLMTAFGVCPEDDDGNAASKGRSEPVKQDGPPVLIGDAALATIQTLIATAEADTAWILNHYGISDMRVMTVAMYDDCCANLRAKIKADQE